jgi:hypothetical protein
MRPGAESGEELMADDLVITPSEIVVLRPLELAVDQPVERKVSPRLLGQDRLDHAPSGPTTRLFEDGAELPAVAWAQEILAVALLALEDRGVLVFEEREVTRLAGLSRHPALVASRGERENADVAWPRPSLEDGLRLRSEEHEVAGIVADWLGTRSDSPAISALEKARACLVKRGLVDEQRETRWLVVTRSRYLVPASTQASVREVAAVRSLVERCCRERPATWAALNRDIARGIEMRVDHSDDYAFLED